MKQLMSITTIALEYSREAHDSSQRVINDIIHVTLLQLVYYFILKS